MGTRKKSKAKLSPVRVTRRTGGRSRSAPFLLCLPDPARGRKPKGVCVEAGQTYTRNHWTPTGPVTVSVYNKSQFSKVYVR